MSLYFGAIEITNIDNLVPQSGLDITDMWFGTANVYTVWSTYEGTLPATINANGADMRQYQIYGNVGGVGDDSGTEYGYEIDISTSDGTNTTTTPIYIGDEPLGKDEYVDFLEQKIYRKSQNDIDLSGQTNKTTQGVSYTVNSLAGTITAKRVSSGTNHAQYFVSIPTTLHGNLYFKACPSGGGASTYYVFMWDRTTGARPKKHNGTTNAENDLGKGNYLEVSVVEGHDTVMIIQVAQGYSADNVVFTPYIGTVNTSLTPTDPPVALSALPTAEGETVVDYAGQSVIQPEKTFLKYRKENF